MAIAVQVPGPCRVYVGTGVSGALEELGYTVNGANVEEDTMYSDVPTDACGDGPAADVQYQGEIHRVRLELSKWDQAIAAKLTAKIRGGTAGAIG